MNLFARWQNFYVMAGSSAGALIGLQFVVMGLLTQMRTGRVDPQAATAFSTPTVIHFGTVLGLSGILCAPWDGAAAPSVIWGLVGLAGSVYAGIIIHIMRSQTAYRPELEDWVFHAVLPAAAYATLVASAFTAHFRLPESLYAVGAAALILLATGIHNAWDTVTYHILVKAQKEDAPR